ncbi:MAG: hypothetical protein AAB606_02515 [Patescibacteria group bacterium]
MSKRFDATVRKNPQAKLPKRFAAFVAQFIENRRKEITPQLVVLTIIALTIHAFWAMIYVFYFTKLP